MKKVIINLFYFVAGNEMPHKEAEKKTATLMLLLVFIMILIAVKYGNGPIHGSFLNDPAIEAVDLK